MIKYTLIACLTMTLNLVAMEKKEDLNAFPYELLKKRWDENIKKRDAFNAKYSQQEWRKDPKLEAQLDALTAEHRQLMNAMVFGGKIPRELIKPHCITSNQPAANISNNNDGKELAPSLKKYCRTIEEIQESAERSNSKVQPVAKKQKSIAQEQEDDIEQQIKTLIKRQNELFACCNNSNIKESAEESDEIEYQLQALYERRNKQKRQQSVL